MKKRWLLLAFLLLFGGCKKLPEKIAPPQSPIANTSGAPEISTKVPPVVFDIYAINDLHGRLKAEIKKW